MLNDFLPPTDNLYKFIAISGLMLVVFSFVPSYFSFKFTEQQIGYIGEQNRFIIESTQLDKDLEKYTKNQDSLNTDLDGLIKKLDENKELSIEANQDLKRKKRKNSKEKYQQFIIGKKENEEKNENYNKLKKI